MLSAAAVGVMMGEAPSRLRSASLDTRVSVLEECRDCIDTSGSVHTVSSITVAADEATKPQARPVRIVCISDTHGFEASLGSLPSGDILVHAGDFWKDGKHADALIAHTKFDRWLAEQPHPIKLVVRGNHDPRHVSFPCSGACYFATEPLATRDFHGLRFAFAPYPSRGVVRSLLPPVDVLVSHVPCRGVLDECYGGQRVGSTLLRDAVNAQAAPPRVWICGHIHESRGTARVRFGGGGLVSGCCDLPTTVINAAMANTGIAERLVRGAVAVHIEPSLRPRAPLVAETCGGGAQAARLLAVLVSPDAPPHVALFAAHTAAAGGDGSRRAPAALLAYRQIGDVLAATNDDGSAPPSAGSAGSLRDREAVLRAVLLALHHFEPSCRGAHASDGSDDGSAAHAEEASRPQPHERGDQATSKHVSHIVVGSSCGATLSAADVRHLGAAVAAALHDSAGRVATAGGGAEPPPLVLQLSRAVWVGALLRPREHASESSAATAARLIAQQVIDDLADATASHAAPPLSVQQSEAILTGYVALLQLGWLRREPAVRRYANGKLVQASAPQAMHRKARKRLQRQRRGSE